MFYYTVTKGRLSVEGKKNFSTEYMLNVIAWNIRCLGQKDHEIIDHQKIDIAVVTESKKRLKGTTDVIELKRETKHR